MMNLPPPGSPEFNKLISGQPKPDYTKPVVLKLPTSLGKKTISESGFGCFAGFVEFQKQVAAGKPANAIRGGQLDCTEIEATRTARCFDWDSRDKQLCELERRIAK